MQVSKTDISRDSTQTIPLTAHRHSQCGTGWNLISANCISQAAPAARAFGCVVQWEVLAQGWEAGGREKPGCMPVSAQISSSVSVSCWLHWAFPSPLWLQMAAAPWSHSSLSCLTFLCPLQDLQNPLNIFPQLNPIYWSAWYKFGFSDWILPFTDRKSKEANNHLIISQLSIKYL